MKISQISEWTCNFLVVILIVTAVLWVYFFPVFSYYVLGEQFWVLSLPQLGAIWLSVGVLIIFFAIGFFFLGQRSRNKGVK